MLQERLSYPDATSWNVADFVSGRVSVVVPIYNRRHMLKHVLMAVKDQSYGDIELIVIDDGSNDLTQGIFMAEVRQAGLAGRAHYFRKENAGPAAARNLGIFHSNGEYIYFLDSDDLVFHDAIEKLVAAMRDQSRAYCVGRAMDVSFSLDEIFGDSHRPCPGHILRSAEWNTHASLYRKEAVLALGGFDESLRLGEDTIFQVRMMLAYGEGARCPEFVGVRRRHDYGHLSFGAVSIEDQARYMVATAKIIAGNPAFRNEKYLVRLSSAARFLCFVTQSRALTARTRRAYGEIVATLMHDSRFEMACFKWLSAPDANIRTVLASMILTGVKRLCESILGARRLMRRRELENEVVATSVGRLSSLLGQVEQSSRHGDAVAAPGLFSRLPTAATGN